MADFVQVDRDPWVILQGTTSTVGWAVEVDGAPIASPWQARGQIRASVESATALETFTPVISDGVVSYTFDAASTAGMAWRAGVMGVEVYDDTVSPERAYWVAKAPITVEPEVVR